MPRQASQGTQGARRKAAAVAKPKYAFHPDKATTKRMKLQSHGKSRVEDELAHALWHRGIRYRRDYRKLPGTPDIAITTRKVAVFVDGEFWHGYDWENQKKRIKRNRDYWIPKIERNMQRDKEKDAALRKLGWIPLHFWGKAVTKDTEGCVSTIERALDSVAHGRADAGQPDAGLPSPR